MGFAPSTRIIKNKKGKGSYNRKKSSPIKDISSKYTIHVLRRNR
ncbi:alternative ribosome rescue factor ArfA [Peribacillus simplex]